ncbi:MAG: hypothetical protein ACJAZF_001337, partial [Granulosicoccus sp.]
TKHNVHTNDTNACEMRQVTRVDLGFVCDDIFTVKTQNVEYRILPIPCTFPYLLRNTTQ